MHQQSDPYCSTLFWFPILPLLPSSFPWAALRPLRALSSFDPFSLTRLGGSQNAGWYQHKLGLVSCCSCLIPPSSFKDARAGGKEKKRRRKREPFDSACVVDVYGRCRWRFKEQNYMLFESSVLGKFQCCSLKVAIIRSKKQRTPRTQNGNQKRCFQKWKKKTPIPRHFILSSLSA